MGLWAPASQPLCWVTSEPPAPSRIVRSTPPQPQLMCIWALSDPHSWDHWVLAQLREVATRKYFTQGGIELEFEPLSAWSLTVPTFQNILSVLAINLNRFWGGRERGGMKGGSSEAERKWQGPGSPGNPGHIHKCHQCRNGTILMSRPHAPHPPPNGQGRMHSQLAFKLHGLSAVGALVNLWVFLN